MSNLGVPVEEKIYTGAWINWSHGKIAGSTITLSQRDGALLVAFIALFVSFAGTSFFRITSFVLHQVFSSEVPQDVLHHQRQAILRNSPDGTTSLLSLGQILCYWRRKGHRINRRILPLIIHTAVITTAFGVAGIFSFRIAALTGDEVLIKSPVTHYQSNSNLSAEDEADIFGSYMSQRLSAFTSYAQDCYSPAPRNSYCIEYVKPRLLANVDRNATCPFADSMCKMKYGNVRVDTGYLNSHLDLGINAPPEKQILWRHVLHCAPLVTDGYAESYNFTNGSVSLPYRRYRYGQLRSSSHVKSNFTYLQPEYTQQQFMFEKMETQFPRYALGAHSAYYFNGTVDDSEIQLHPVQGLQRPDSDVILAFLSSQGITYTGQVKDPWFSANRQAGKISAYRTTADNTTVSSIPIFVSDEAASPLGCTEQYQICAQSKDRCSPLSSITDIASFRSAALTGDQNKMTASFQKYFSPVGLTALLNSLGSETLEAKFTLYQGRAPPLPDDQWQTETIRWSNILLAALQGSAVDAATGPSDPKANIIFYSAPRNKQDDYILRNQKIRSTAYMNFSILGLGLTLAIGALFLIIQNLMTTIYSQWPFTHHKKNKYARLEWESNGVLQLQRLAHEELGFGEWRNCDKEVPIPRDALTKLAMLNISDPKHPRLKRLDGFVMNEVVEAGIKVESLPSFKDSPDGDRASSSSQDKSPGGYSAPADIEPLDEATNAHKDAPTSGIEAEMPLAEVSVESNFNVESR